MNMVRAVTIKKLLTIGIHTSCVMTIQTLTVMSSLLLASMADEVLVLTKKIMIMKVLRFIVVAGMCICSCFVTKAQDKVEGSMVVDVVSQYVWRGQDLGNASIQPGLGISYKGLSLSAWGSVGLTSADDTKEFDLTLGYSAGGFNIGVTDYWFNAGLDGKNRYFRYNSHSTNHVFEGNIGYDFGCLSLQWYTNFAGNDGVNEDGDRAYSSYFEIGVPFSFVSCNWEAAVGAVPFATSFYGTTGFAVTEVALKATKEFSIGDKVTVPVYMGVSANPCSQNCHFYAGFAFQL